MKNNFLPVDTLPKTGYPENKSVFWFQKDNAVEYERKGNHQYDDHRIIYKFNDYGYRCENFDKDADIKVLSVGCSYVFGIALHEEEIFHQRFTNEVCTKLSKSVINWNLGMTGASNDYIARVLHIAVPILNPDIVLINFTRLPRREYVAAHGRLVNYTPNFTPKDEIGREIYSHFSNLTSQYDDAVNLFKNYKSIASLLSGKIWLYSFMTNSERKCIEEHLDKKRLVGSFLYDDKARDNEHPGRLSHEAVFHKYWDKFIQLGSLDTLKNK